MQYTLTINCDNDAFVDDPGQEIQRILRDTRDRINVRGLEDEVILRDINGARVGTATFTSDLETYREIPTLSEED